jgi:spermidine synthase
MSTRDDAYLDAWRGRLAWLRDEPDGTLLATTASRDGAGILLVKHGSQIRLFFADTSPMAHGGNVKLSGVMSRIDLDDPLNLLGLYTQAMVLALAWVPHPRRVYMLGFGGGRVPMVLRHYLPDVIIDGSELDREILDIARDHFGVTFDDRMNVVAGDGRAHLAAMPADAPKYDVLLIDCFTGGGHHPVDLATPAFYALCKSRLSPGGVVATNLVGSDPQCKAKIDWFTSSFRHVADWQSGGAHVLFGTDGEALMRADIIRRAESLKREHGFHFPLVKRAREIRVVVRRDHPPRADAGQA